MGTCLWSALFFAAAIVGGPQRSPLRFDQVHHIYFGEAACVLGATTHSRVLLTVGRVVASDDAIQHVYQRVNLLDGNPGALAIRSPLNIGYRFTLGRLPLFQKLNRLLDYLLR